MSAGQVALFADSVFNLVFFYLIVLKEYFCLARLVQNICAINVNNKDQAA